jgi:predicted nucleotidyltransferase
MGFINLSKILSMYIDSYITRLQNLCLQNKVKTLYVFGSVLSDKFNDTSDIDLVVDIDSNDPFDYADSYFNLKFALQDLFKRQIDLLENKAIKNPIIRSNIERSKKLIYAK